MKGKTYKSRYFIKLGMTLLLAVIVFKFIYGIYIMHGNYMFPALRDGDFVITYRLEVPRSSEIVAYKAGGKYYLGRVVAGEGDIVEIGENGELLINGGTPAEEIFYPTLRAEESEITYPYQVSDGCVFVLNDYRTLENLDSRTMGEISRKDLGGKLAFLLRRRGF